MESVIDLVILNQISFCYDTCWLVIWMQIFLYFRSFDCVLCERIDGFVQDCGGLHCISCGDTEVLR